MLSTISILIALSIGLSQALFSVDESCEVKIYTSDGPCTGTIWVYGPCNESTANLAETSLKSCDTIALTWAYPMKNLTLIIESSYTKEHQAYAIQFDNRPFQSPTTFHLYRILDGKETIINSPDAFVTEKSDSNYQVILKVEAPYTISRYILNFGYSVTKF